MRSVDARTGIELIGRDECLKLLAADVVGRLGVVAGGTPMIVPVNYALDGDAGVVFRTAPGTKLDLGVRSPACFEIDRFDPATRTGWSVLVTGRLEEIGSLEREWARIHGLPVDPWAAGEKSHWLRLTTDRVTGRRVA